MDARADSVTAPSPNAPMAGAEPEHLPAGSKRQDRDKVELRRVATAVTNDLLQDFGLVKGSAGVVIALIPNPIQLAKEPISMKDVIANKRVLRAILSHFPTKVPSKMEAKQILAEFYGACNAEFPQQLLNKDRCAFHACFFAVQCAHARSLEVGTVLCFATKPKAT